MKSKKEELAVPSPKIVSRGDNEEITIDETGNYQSREEKYSDDGTATPRGTDKAQPLINPAKGMED